MVSAVPAGAGMAAGFASAALLGKEITGSATWGTLAAASLMVGSALSTVPLARYMSHHGRRRGLRIGWMIAAIGMVLALAAAVADFYPLLLLGILALGVGNAANLSARYAAADLATEANRAKSIGLVVWAGSFGSVLGPALGLGVVGSAGVWFGLPELAGPYLMGAILLLAAVVFIEKRLRPDPLVAAGGVTPPSEGDSEGGAVAAIGARFADGARPLAQVFRNPAARLAVVAMMTGHAVMVGIMTATPLHMEDGNHEFQIIGFVISVHIIGMYFFAPVVGWLADRVGPRPLIAVGGVILFIGAEMASHTEAGDSAGVFIGLFLVGLGWAFGLISGSSLLTASFPVDQRVNVQGAADLVMSTSGALAALSAGIVYELGGYYDLSHWAGLGALALSGYATWRIIRIRVSRGPTISART
jgi:MFS family permease